MGNDIRNWDYGKNKLKFQFYNSMVVTLSRKNELK